MVTVTDSVSSLANYYLSHYGLTAQGWRFVYDRAKRRAGCCKFGKKQITMSQNYVLHNNAEDIKDTILHEIAHALVGPKHGHDDTWRAMCIKVGAKPQRCYGNHVVMPVGRWRATCPKCKKAYHKHRRPKYLYNRYCIACGPVEGHLTYSCLRSD